ncbi:MAG: transpeptidase family protein [Bacteroidales bacterium]|nr:transpeptidase family protein [Bacteroidales bacterium]MCK9500175.1 transpeptidase family protein [Bacteroidales bacterium]MDY0314392.1 penicillin-binding protein [Bacteroidales bacterium]NLB86832.1 transpeptidase family protein [Bacteroidales bacterium]
MSSRRSILIKYNTLYLILILVSMYFVYKIIYFQFFYDKALIEDALKTTKVYASIEPRRGDIYSSDEKLLVTSIAYYEVGMDPNSDAITQKIFDENLDSLSLCLSQVIPTKTKEQFRNELIRARDSGSRYYRFSFNLNYSDFKKMSDFPLLRRGRLKGGFVYQKNYIRENLFGQLAKRTLGTQPTDRANGVGLEDFFNEELKGVEGHTINERIAGNFWMPIEDAQYIEPQNGYDLITTINIELQDIVETALEKQLTKCEAGFGTVVVMEVKTGKVLAIANKELDSKGKYVEKTNHAVAYAIDPGSTFKLASAIIALEDGYITPDDIIDTGNGSKKISYKIVRDTKTGGYGEISFQRVIEVSSNIGIATVIYNNYKNNPLKFYNGIEKLNLTKPLGVSIKGETTPIVSKPNTSSWSGISLVQMSMGYELQITPLQILAFYNAIANNGKLLKPIFAEALADKNKIIKYFEPEVLNEQICSHKTLSQVQKMLLEVVENGTAKNIKNENYKIAGKTGTAQMNYGKDSLPTEYHASFVGYFPADAPEFSCIVSIYEPKNGFYGASVSAPVFKEIADKIYSLNPKYYKASTDENTICSKPVLKKGSKQETNKVFNWFGYKIDLKEVNQTDWITGTYTEDAIKLKPVSFSDNRKVPDVRNMGLKDAVVVLENAGLSTQTHGRGRIYKQTPNAGSELRKGDKVILYLCE